MDSRGADSPQSLRVVDIDAGVEVGDPLALDGAEIGTITSVSPTGGVADRARQPWPRRRPPSGPPRHQLTRFGAKVALRRDGGSELRWGGEVNGVGGREIAANGDHVGMLADADQFRRRVDDHGEHPDGDVPASAAVRSQPKQSASRSPSAPAGRGRSCRGYTRGGTYCPTFETPVKDIIAGTRGIMHGNHRLRSR